MMTCVSCHSGIPQSRQTGDVNLPGIATCRKCHQAAGATAHAAEGRCFECHSYHDWRQEQRIQGKYDLAVLRAKSLDQSKPDTSQANQQSQQPSEPKQ